MPHDGYGGWDGGWHMAWMGFWWLIANVGIVLLVMWIGRGGRGPRWREREDPEDSVRRRYARGEINREELEERLSGLRH